MNLLHAVGDRAILVDCDDLEAVLALNAALTVAPPDGIVDIVPAARTVLVTFDPARLSADRVTGWIRSTPPVPPEVWGYSDVVEIDVQYSGEDLAEVAALLSTSEREVVQAHTASVWRVAFVGFAPGFGYLVTDSPQLVVPRRASPRTSVPAGSVGLAGEYTGVYPRSSPGGWQIIGRTDAVLWDPDATTPALLVPGRVVRFREAS
ncbi:5-oxoprolinase subunit PxpB [Mycetocola miduiensis]|uniref:Sensor histidine kinase inhibitor, KipI family n=1 Tax=Mycetocola miduiensis TaxID=995034 RepID=A0A1I5D0S5_9MICO|nr:5-oxoprolinase subunit PxpB [Mycetocola miduiensis]SFN92835.1 sensor histidine kinase inhibitor, KipI family [Mycetocola miduiensis]